jgi:hypothetical protein
VSGLSAGDRLRFAIKERVTRMLEDARTGRAGSDGMTPRAERVRRARSYSSQSSGVD